MAFHSHKRGNEGYGGADRSRGDSAKALPTFDQEEEARRKIQEASALLGGNLPALGEEETPEAILNAIAGQFPTGGADIPPFPDNGVPMKNITPGREDDDAPVFVPLRPLIEAAYDLLTSEPAAIEPPTEPEEPAGPVLERIPEPPAPARRRRPARHMDGSPAALPPPPLLETPEGAGPVYSVRVADIADLREDPANARTHNPRNIGLIVDAVNEVGVGRSVVIDEAYTLLAGNGAKEACQEAGIRKVLIVETDGETLVAVQRRGLTDHQKTRLALFDNRASDLSEFDPSALMELHFEDETLLHNIFSEDEVAAIGAAADLQEAEAATADNAGPIFGEEGVQGPNGRPKRLAFRLEFDNAEQHRKFNRFRGWLKNSYGGDDTEAGQWIAFLEEHHSEELGD